MTRRLHTCLHGRIPIQGAPPPRYGAPADGHTVILIYTRRATGPTLHSKLPDDTLEDFRPPHCVLRCPSCSRRIRGLPANTPGQFDALIRSELTKWAAVIKQASMQID